jgi:sulfatase modifying factor 1
MSELHQPSCCSAKRDVVTPLPKKLSVSAAATIASPVRKPETSQSMIYLAGGSFLMGTDSKEGFPADAEGPVREETVKPFYIDATTVTNEQFAAFTDATGYITEAEQFGWSFVFHLFVSKTTAAKVDAAVPGATWWWKVDGADWRHPEGPDSDIESRQDHPAVHLSWNDAAAYCEWAGKRLPTEEEWEYAARGGLEQKRYPWGDELTPGGEHRCNIWQGQFPVINTADDGYAGTAPVRSYLPNGYGLYNMSGNVWEWCSNWFDAGKQQKAVRGGSYLCHESYCNRYRVAARTSNTPDSSTGHMGFRCVRDV